MNPIIYTIGEPAGIGADIILQLASEQSLIDVICLGDINLLKQRSEDLGIDIRFVNYPDMSTNQRELAVWHHPMEQLDFSDGPTEKNAWAVLSLLDLAVEGCLSGEFSAMVTGPLHKGIINDAGIPFSGHTEYLANKTNSELPVMLLASDDLKVALLTTHLPLKDVSDSITQELIIKITTIIDRDLKTKYGIDNARILVCGLNPHAGEGGHLGMEEIETIIPALESLRKLGVNVIGPLPADTLFTEKYLADADVVLAMYHDQGLPVLKAKSFGNAANITLGLPIIRTSVDHGTACDIAGTGLADVGSLVAAMAAARKMASLASKNDRIAK